MDKQSTQTRLNGLRERSGQYHYRFKVNGQEYSGNTELAARL
jgi:hypothetical protein